MQQTVDWVHALPAARSIDAEAATGDQIFSSDRSQVLEHFLTRGV